MTTTPSPDWLRERAEQALRCLYIEAPKPVADDVYAKVRAFVDALVARAEEAEARAALVPDLVEALTRAANFIGQTREYKTGHTGAVDILGAANTALAQAQAVSRPVDGGERG